MRRSHFLLAAFIAIFPTLLPAQKPRDYPATLFVSYNGAPVYGAADYKAEILGNLRIGDSVVAVGIDGKFFRIAYKGGVGFVLGTNLSITPKRSRGSEKREAGRARPDSISADSATTRAGGKEPKRRRGATGSSDTTVTRNRRSGRDRQPGSGSDVSRSADSTTRDNAKPVSTTQPADSQAASGRCRGTTKSGKPCSRTTSDPSGYCWQHKK